MSRETIKKTEDPVENAFLAGYWIGYTGNSEWIGEGSELKREVFKEAEAAGKLREAIKAYKEGKLSGRTARERELLRGIGAKVEGGEKRRLRNIKVEPPKLSDRVRRETFLHRMGTLDIPGILIKRKMLHSPRFLRR